MTDQLMSNGRATQQQLYAAISEMRGEMREGFADVRSDLKAFDGRLRTVEYAQVSEQAHDDEREMVLRELREAKTEQTVSKRWIIGIGVTVMLSLGVSLFGWVTHL